MHGITISAIMLPLLLISMLMSAFQVHQVKAERISPTLLETIYMDTTNPNLVWSNTILEKGLQYLVEVSGTYFFNGAGGDDVADAEYSSYDNWITITKEYVYPPTVEVFPHVLDLLVNEINVDWGEYNPSHVYSINFLGTGTPISLVISDWYGEGTYPHPGAENNGDVSDNQGILTVRIYLAARVKGIDVSDDIDWTGMYDKGYDFAFVKATEGIDFKLLGFEQRVENALGAELLAGVYHFGRPVPNKDGAKAEAESFVRLAAPYLADGYLRPVLDVEDNDYGEHPEVLDKEPLAQWIKDWMDTVEEKTCVRPVLYMNPFLFEFLSDSSIVDQYDIWVYDARDTEPATDDLPDTRGWRTWTFWQYEWDVAFGNGVADLDSFNGDETALRKLIIARSDLNSDGKVNIQDIALVAKAWGCRISDPNWNRAADLNNDGVINIVDISRVASKFGWLVGWGKVLSPHTHKKTESSLE